MVKIDAWNWAKEERYYGMKKRAAPIVEYISKLEPMNTLVLCRPELGAHVADLLGTICINKDVPNETRDELFSKFKTKGSEIVVASFDTSATGISQNMIHRVILLDAGKDETTVLQGIGRGIRLDGDTNRCEVIDISANTLYAEAHRKERKKIYKREKFIFSDREEKIKVFDE
jgi:superfamily II DNA/RNA helicase